MRLVSLFTVALLVGVAYGLYQLSFQVEALQDHAAALEKQIEDDKEAIGVLEAEWALLNNPQRLEQLSHRFLDLTPTEPAQIKSIDDLAVRQDGMEGAAFMAPAPVDEHPTMLADAPANVVPAATPVVNAAPALTLNVRMDLSDNVQIVPASTVRSAP